MSALSSIPTGSPPEFISAVHEMKPILLAHATKEELEESLEILQKLRIENPICCVNRPRGLFDYLEGKGDYRDRSKHSHPVLVLLDAATAATKDWVNYRSKNRIASVVTSPDGFDLAERITMSSGILLEQTKTGYKVVRDHF